jgi:hypothetical protein
MARPPTPKVTVEPIIAPAHPQAALVVSADCAFGGGGFGYGANSAFGGGDGDSDNNRMHSRL